MTGVHRAAAVGFQRSADLYERARPEYADEAIAWLHERLELGPGVMVLDLAAGTGKLTRRLIATGTEVVAVEPLANMRAAIGPGARLLEGTAEAIPLADASVDAVCVAQAFHWFDGDAALAEIHRVLRPGGRLALVWSRRRMEDPLQAALEEILGPHRKDTPTHRGDRWREAFDRSDLFGPIEERDFPYAQRLDAEGLAARIGSISFIAALDEADREPLLDRVRALSGGEEVELRYRCEVQVTTRRPARRGPRRT